MSPKYYGIENYEDLYIKTEDKILIHGWLIKSPNNHLKNKVTILYLHGNAGNIGHRLYNIKCLYDNGYNVFIIDYRGYGNSEIDPKHGICEEGIINDANCALQFLNARDDISNNIIIFGRSLGGAVAISLSETNFEYKGFILENTFTSIYDCVIDISNAYFNRIKSKYLKLFIRHFLKDKWKSNERIKNLKKPVLILTGLDDKVVNPSHSDSLYNSLSSKVYSKIVKFPNCGHTDIFITHEELYYERINEFISKITDELVL